MIRVTVTFSAQIRATVGAESVALEVERGATVREVVGRLATEHGEDFRRLVLQGDEALRPSTLVFLDGEQVRDAAARIPADGAELFLSVPVAGG